MNKTLLFFFLILIYLSGCIHLDKTTSEEIIIENNSIYEDSFETNMDSSNQEPITKKYDLSFDITAVPNKHPEMIPYFEKYGEIFGIPFFATRGVTDDKLLHAMNIMAQYLDNDENGIPDNTLVLDELLKEEGGMIMFANHREAENSDAWDSDAPMYRYAELHGEEVIISGSRFDASLEEIFHLITDTGYEGVYPSVFGEFSGSELANLMDNARGGHFENEGTIIEDGHSFQSAVPKSYPASAWYTYDDKSCRYDCMNTEYIYWAMTSILGAQENRCNEIDHEWKLCTKEKVKNQDPGIYNLLTNPDYGFPTILPDGSYGR